MDLGTLLSTSIASVLEALQCFRSPLQLSDLFCVEVELEGPYVWRIDRPAYQLLPLILALPNM